MIPYIRDHPCAEALQLTIQTAADHNLDQYINQLRSPHTKMHHNPENLTVLHTLRKAPESQ